MIAVLCALENSIYKTLPNLDVYDKKRNAYLYDLDFPVIAHPPCQQWSRLKHFAKFDREERDLAFFCLEKVQKNGGILEHPSGSSFFKQAGIKPTISIDQSWFGFSCRKRTYLYFHDCKPISFPLSFDLITKRVPDLTGEMRSYTTIRFANWLIDFIKQSTGDYDGFPLDDWRFYEKPF